MGLNGAMILTHERVELISFDYASIDSHKISAFPHIQICNFKANYTIEEQKTLNLI